MELTQQVSTLQEELKLLKGEIKVILKEIRSAVLSRDNPFSVDATPPPFRPVERSEAEDDASARLSALEEELRSSQPPAVPAAAPPPPPAPAAVPPPPPAVASETLPPAAGHAPELAPVPIPIRPHDFQATDGEEQAEQPTKERWSLLTIAGLATWAEESLETLGPRRFKLMLELASFSDFISEEAKDALSGMAEFARERETDDRPMNVNDCMVVLRQLDAVLNGEKIRRLPQRRVRHSRVR